MRYWLIGAAVALPALVWLGRSWDRDNCGVQHFAWTEAGVIAHNVYVRGDTPVHSMLHEACHLIVLPAERRAQVHTNATDSVIEEDATCCLQIILADDLPGVGRHRLMGDMDAWGYTYRLGSTRGWFEQDADDARAFLKERGLPHR